MIADCRFPGGTSAAIADELRALAPTGLRVGLVHVPVAKFRSDCPLHPALLDAWRSGLAEPIKADESIAAEVVVAHNPYGFAHRPLPSTGIRTGKQILVVHSTPLNGQGRLNYDPWTVARYLREGLGDVAVWAPNSALCRQNMADAGLPVPVLCEDWRNIVGADDWGHPRDRPLWPTISLGRHSRAQLDKWPSTRPELFAVYPPNDENVRVRLLGVDERLEALAGGWPRGWEVFRFNEIAPRDFLQTIDFFVYFHHPQLLESFGRCTAEAIASGAVAILPPYMRTNFGDAAVYCTAEEAVATARRIHADPDLYAELSRRGGEIIARDYGPERYRSLVSRVLEAPPDLAGLVRQSPPGLRTLRTHVALRLLQTATTRLRKAAKRRRSILKHVRDDVRRRAKSFRRGIAKVGKHRRSTLKRVRDGIRRRAKSFRKGIPEVGKPLGQRTCCARAEASAGSAGMAQLQPAYQPKQYWERRLSQHFDLQGVGHIAFSTAYNGWLFRRKRRCMGQFFKNRDLRGKDVLDIGCGTGFFVEWYLRQGAKVTGVDITTVSVETLSTKFDADFQVADITDPSFSVHGLFDIVNMWDVIFTSSIPSRSNAPSSTLRNA